MLTKIEDSIYIAQAPLLPFDTLATMTLIKLANNKVVIISPIKPERDLIENIKSLGDVVAVISPSAFHHKYFHEFLGYFPNAQFYYSPAAYEKIKQRLLLFSRYQPLSEDVETVFSKALKPILLDGMPSVGEYVFYHRESKSLVVCDFLFFIREPKHYFAKLFWLIAGIKPQIPMQSRYFRFQIKDKRALQNSIRKLQHLDIKRIIVGHEQIIEGKDLDLAKYYFA